MGPGYAGFERADFGLRTLDVQFGCGPGADPEEVWVWVWVWVRMLVRERSGIRAFGLRMQLTVWFVAGCPRLGLMGLWPYYSGGMRLPFGLRGV